MEDITALKNFHQSPNKMNERQPLLQSDRLVEECATPGLDVCNSPENMLVNIQSEQCCETAKGENKSQYNPSMHRTLDHPTSNFDTMIHLLKGNIGTGILAMPDAFRNSGLYIGLFGTLIMGAICTHCMHILVRCSNELCRRLQHPSLNFSDVAYWCVETGPVPLRRYGNVSRRIITTFLFITQIGFCCVYFLFVALNVKEVVDHYFIKLDVHIYLMLMLIPMIMLNLVKNLKYLAPVSLFAAFLTLAGLAISFSYMLRDLPHADTVKPIASWSTLPLYFGTAIYAFEGIGVVLPLENNMQTPEDFGGIVGVLNTGMVIVACLYTSVGFFGYLKYGDDVKASITLNLPQDDILSQMVRIALAAAIFLSYALQFYVPVNIVEPFVQRQFETQRGKDLAGITLRVVLVTCTFILAASIPNLGPIISLVGAMSSSALALIAPPIIEIMTFWSVGLGRYNWIMWKDIAIVVFGLSGFTFGTYASIAQILNPSIV